MKQILIVAVILLFVIAGVEATDRPGPRNAAPVASELDPDTYIDANNIMMFLANDGSFGRDLSALFGYGYGTFYPYSGISHILDASQIASPLYAAGLWMGGIDSATGTLRVKIAEYGSEYWQGPWETNAVFFDNPSYKVYKLYRDSLAGNPNADYLNWIKASRQGAPFVGDSATPPMIGDQYCWTVYHDRTDTFKYNNAGHTGPIGVEIRQEAFAFGNVSDLQNVIFMKFQVFNRGTRTINGFYLSLWTDPDLGGAGDDLVGCDTIRELGFVYNSTNADSKYGSTPPCLGIDFLQGPLVFTGNVADTGRGWGASWPGYRNLTMSSFAKYINGTDPVDSAQTYYYMSGLQRDGTPYMYNGQQLKFVHSGDPVTTSGDLDFAPADRRMMQSVGPLTFRPNDSLEIIAAIVIGQGADRLSSIAAMKYTDQFVQNLYDASCFAPEPCNKCCVGSTGNVNMIGSVDLSDLTALVQYLTGYGYVPLCIEEANINNVGIVDLSDLSALVSHLTGGDFVFPPCQ